MDEMVEARRELEYVALLSYKINTRNGIAYMFVAVDAFTCRTFYLNTERDESPESVLKSIHLLTEREEFKNSSWRGYTLVLKDYESLADQIKALIQAQGGKLIYNEAINTFIATPYLEAMANFREDNECTNV